MMQTSPLRRTGGASLARHAAAVAAVLSALAVAGCSTAYIPHTDVAHTSENRKVVLFCENYRRAVEEKDVGQLLKLASDRYYEDGGNTNVEDDIDYAGLKEYLTSAFVLAGSSTFGNPRAPKDGYRVFLQRGLGWTKRDDRWNLPCLSGWTPSAAGRS